jgi:hypothetical protein
VKNRVIFQLARDRKQMGPQGDLLLSVSYIFEFVL